MYRIQCMQYNFNSYGVVDDKDVMFFKIFVNFMLSWLPKSYMFNCPHIREVHFPRLVTQLKAQYSKQMFYVFFSHPKHV